MCAWTMQISMRRSQDCALNAMRLGVSNARAEALDSQIRALRVNARGYRNKSRFVPLGRMTNQEL
ncbi:transposase [Achromobacter denitrificans]|uniref:transposase n=1 Tax=Achromobacter denitrificans TaxID=32002 RepID=UPI0030B89A8A